MNPSITQSGRVTAQLWDHESNKSEEVFWNINYQPIGNNSPKIISSAVKSGQQYSIQSFSNDFYFPFHAEDIDGDLHSVEMYIDGALLRTYALSADQSYTTYRYELGSDIQDFELNSEELIQPGSIDRTTPANIEWRVLDAQGNFDSITAQVAWGPYNHSSEYPDEPTHIAVDEDGEALFAPDVFDEDGDVQHCTVNTAPSHGRLDATETRTWAYRPFANFAGQDAFSLACSDLYGSEGIIDYIATVTAVNDAPVLVTEGDSTDVVVVRTLRPGETLDISSVVEALILTDAEQGELDLANTTTVVVGMDDGIVLGQPVTKAKQSIRSSKLGGSLPVISIDKSADEISQLSIVFLDENGLQSNALVLLIEYLKSLDVDGDDDGDANDLLMILRATLGVRTVTQFIPLPINVGGAGDDGARTNAEIVAAANDVIASVPFDVDGDNDGDANDLLMILRASLGVRTVTQFIPLPSAVGGAGEGGVRTNAEIVGAAQEVTQ